MFLLCSFSCRSEGTRTARETTSRGALLDSERVAPSPSASGATRKPGTAILEDGDIQDAVARALLKDPIVPSDEIQVQVSDGLVELTGQVAHLLARERATLLAESIKGVRSVSARLSLAPIGREDAAIEYDIGQELASDPAVEESNMQVLVLEGVATLRGTADSWIEKETAERRSKSVTGVRAVENLLTIKNEVPRSDDEIRADVRKRLFWDALVDDRLLVVTSESKRVAISGVVRSAAEYRRAKSDAWVPGVEDVEVAHVDVDWSLKDGYEQLMREPIVGDRDIANAIEWALMLDPRVSLFAIEPVVQDGIVTLGGKVNSLSTKNAAEHIARHTVGVEGVRNRIEVSTHTRDGPSARQSIEAALERNAIAAALDISTRVDDGRATLTGQVDSFAEMAEASAIAGQTPGVVSVDNQLRVRRPDGFYVDPYIYPYQPYAESWTAYAGVQPAKTDSAILQDIRTEMFWNPFIDPKDIEVTVLGGRATLAGQVDRWLERESAEKNAYEGGAMAVDNQIEVAVDQVPVGE